MRSDREVIEVNSKPILIIGATGKTGKRIVKKLQQLNQPVRIGSRMGTPPFDWEDNKTWQAALEGTKSAYISYYPDLAVPKAAEDIRELTMLAEKVGLKRLVLLSGRGEEGAQQAEEMLKNSTIDWTIIRSSWFAQNFSEGFLLDQIKAGEVALPVGRIPEPFIDVEDIADVAVKALTEPGHARKLYEVTGTNSISFREATESIANTIDKQIVYTELSIEDFRSRLQQAQTPHVYIEFLTELFTQVFDGRNVNPQSGIQDALGRSPRTFDDYVKRTAQSGIWAN